MDRSQEFPSFEGEEDMTKRLLSKKATNKGEDKPVPARVHSADLHLYRQVPPSIRGVKTQG